MSEQANADEGADPSADIKKQNSGETTLADIRNDGAAQRAGSGDDDTRSEGQGSEASKTQDLAKAGRDDFDPNESQE
jgi:hypothetical protein